LLSDKPEVKQDKRDEEIRFAGRHHQRLDEYQSECADDIARLCPEIPRGNNFALLVCLQEKAKVRLVSMVTDRKASQSAHIVS